MARTNLPVTTMVAPLPTTGTLVTLTAADTVNNNSFVWSRNRSLLVFNTSAATGYTFTVTSLSDPYGRTGDITALAIAAQAIYTVGPFAPEAWRQTDGTVWVSGSNASVLFGILANPLL
jgi:hypothetical protein